MIRKELIKILENVLEQEEDNKCSQPLAHLLIRILNDNNIDIHELNNLIEDNFFYKNNEDFYEEEYNQPLQSIDIIEHDYSHNKHLKNYHSKENNLKKFNTEHHKRTHIDSEELFNLLKSLVDNTFTNMPIVKTEQNTSNTYNRNILNKKSMHPSVLDENTSNRLKNTSYNLGEDNILRSQVHKNEFQQNNLSDNLKQNVSNFFESMHLQNKTGNFRCAFIYEQLNNKILDKPTNFYDKSFNYIDSKDNRDKSYVTENNDINKEEIEQKNNKQILDNVGNTLSKREPKQVSNEQGMYTENSPLEKNINIQKEQESYNSGYKPRYINRYKNNFKPLKYVRVTEPSEKVSSFLKNKLK